MKMIAILIGILILYSLQTFIYAKYWNRKLNIMVRFSQTHIVEGGEVIIEEKLENRKWLPLPSVTIKYNLAKTFKETDVIQETMSDHYNRNEVFSILMHQRITRKLQFNCTRRGIFKIEDLSVQASSFFLNEDYMQNFQNDSILTVYPRSVSVHQFMELFQNVYGMVITKQFLMEDPFLSRGVREYQTYDTLKMINWGASAKTGDLKVNVLEHTAQRDVAVLLNIQRDTILLGSEVSEESIRLAKTFCQEFARQGIKSLLYSNGRDFETGELIQVEHYESGRTYMDVINEKLARMKVKEGGNVYQEYEEENFIDLYEEKIHKLAAKRFLIFISNYQHDDFTNLLCQLKDRNQQFVWIVPVSNRADFHVVAKLKKETKIWRLNWEGASRRS